MPLSNILGGIVLSSCKMRLNSLNEEVGAFSDALFASFCDHLEMPVIFTRRSEIKNAIHLV